MKIPTNTPTTTSLNFHFLKRDLITYKFFWILLVVFSAACIPMLSQYPQLWLALVSAYFMFAVSCINNLVGVTWRSQHVMSRNYLLSLPVSRNTMFFLVQSRIIIFWIPFLILVAFLPYILRIYFHHWTSLSYIGFLMTSIFLSLWCINSMIAMQLVWERITSHLTQQQRFNEGLKAIALYILEVCVAVYFLKLSVIQNNGPLLPLGGALVLSSWKILSTRRKWLGLSA